RIAVQFVVNYEEGGERNILHGDATSEAFLSDVLGATPWPGARHMNVESMYEYGSRAGFWRLGGGLFNTRDAAGAVWAWAARSRARQRQSRQCVKRAGRSQATASNGSTTRTCPRKRSARILPRRFASTRRRPGSARWAGTPVAPRSTP